MVLIAAVRVIWLHHEIDTMQWNTFYNNGGFKFSSNNLNNRKWLIIKNYIQ